MQVPTRSFDLHAVVQPLVGPVPAPDLHVMTWNIRRRMPWWWPPPADRWRLRKPLLNRLLAAEHPTILGLQEVMPDQSEDIRTMLGPGYAHVGSGRSATRGGERCEIHYETARLRPLEADTWWLSARPGKPGSRSFGNLVPRLVTQARFEDLRTGVHFNVLVVQLDHLSRRSRTLSAELLLHRVRDLEGPTVLMGDFNDDAGSSLHGRLADGHALQDALVLAGSRAGTGCGTYTRYRPPRPKGRRLDWILATPTATVRLAAVNAVRIAGRAASDHEPVHAVLAWDAAAPGHPERSRPWTV